MFHKFYIVRYLKNYKFFPRSATPQLAVAIRQTYTDYMVCIQTASAFDDF
ncbi:uncharacterized protein METZ01_LOCUS201203, partial [marine metagenome]